MVLPQLITPIHAVLIGMKLAIQLITTKNNSWFNVTKALEPIACVNINVLTELNMVNLIVDLDFHQIFFAHGALYLMKLKLLLLDII